MSFARSLFWHVSPTLHAVFPNLDTIFALPGTPVSRDPQSEVLRVEDAGIGYYVKRYWRAGKGLRRWFGRPRVVAEWQNLDYYFARWGVPAAVVVAYGCERRFGFFKRGALITRELAGSQDLATLAKRGDARLRDAAWVDAVSRQLSEATRRLHAQRFAHNDLKWRNLLVDETGQLFFIDCPAGTFWRGPFLRHRIVKDLACLDKLARVYLSRSQRLRFYLRYVGRPRLTAADKRQIRRIVTFFAGRP